MRTSRPRVIAPIGTMEGYLPVRIASATVGNSRALLVSKLELRFTLWIHVDQKHPVPQVAGKAPDSSWWPFSRFHQHD